MKYAVIGLLLGVTMPFFAIAKGKDHLAACWERQVPKDGNYLKVTFRESTYTIAHLFEPWQTYHSADSGVLWCNGPDFLKRDTLTRWDRITYSRTQLSKSDLLYIGYGSKDLSKVTKNDFDEEPYEESRLCPALLINYFHQLAPAADKESDKTYAVYTLTLHKTIVKLFIRKSDDLLEKVTTLTDNDLYGDVTNTTMFSGFNEINTLFYPSRADVDKVNGKVKDTVIISSVAVTQLPERLLDRPADYKFADEKEPAPELTVDKYNDHIHFVTLKHTNGRSMIVEFKDYLLIAEAPLSSANGELIIQEARKIAPGKPIRYFIFDHYHPDYIGGIRAFVHKGATVLCTSGDLEYVKYIAAAPHTLNPDSLQRQPRQLRTEDIGEQKTITDGTYSMNIYLIGTKSEHTKDYLIYYFPQEKMVFEGDLVGIPEKGPIRKAGKRQAGLYSAIKDLKLDVTTIQQSWPVGYGAKTEIPFKDMEESMNVK